MSQDASPYESAPAADPHYSPSVGDLLIASRERWHYSAADMARQLRLALRQVEALEANRFEALPGNTFVRGFIRNYARAVQADPEALLEAYENMRPHHGATETSAPTQRIEFNPRPTPKWVWYVGILVLLAIATPLGIYFALHDEEAGAKPRLATLAPGGVVSSSASGSTGSAGSAGGPQAGSSAPPPAAPSTVAPALAMAPHAASAVSASSALPPTPAQVSNAAAEQAAKLATPKDASSQAKPGVSGDAVLNLKFEAEAWVEIRDKNGVKVFSQLNRAGTEQTVKADAPLALIVGNAAQVRIAYNGKPVDLAPYIKVNVARLTLE